MLLAMRVCKRAESARSWVAQQGLSYPNHTPEPQIGINGKTGVRKPLLSGIQPTMILVIAAHKEQRTPEFFQERGDLWVFRREEVLKAEHGRIAFAMAPGSPIEACPIWKDTQVAHLQDQVKLLSGFLLPTNAALERQQDISVQISKDRNVHSSPLSPTNGNQ